MDTNTLKKHQPSMTLDEQIQNLRSKGLIIDHMDYARSVLRDISYFRLIKAYSLGLKMKNGNYRENTRFEDIVQLYLFNTDFKHALFPQVEKIEIVLRSRLSNYFCNKYGVLGYLDKNNFSVSEDKYASFSDELQKEINRNVQKPFIKNFQSNYIGGQIPLYALVEIISFGKLSKFYKNMKNEDKKAIASQYGIAYTYFESWLENLSYVRNICAHYGRLYNATITKPPRLYKHHTKEGIRNTSVFATLLVVKQLLPNDIHWLEFVQKVELLIKKYPCVKLSYIGFPQNWSDILKSETIDK